MKLSDLVRYHIQCSIYAAMAESNGFAEEAERLRAQGNLRLMVMSEAELWQLAETFESIPSRPAEALFAEYKQQIAEQKKNSDDWVDSITSKPFRSISRN